MKRLYLPDDLQRRTRWFGTEAESPNVPTLANLNQGPPRSMDRSSRGERRQSIEPRPSWEPSRATGRRDKEQPETLSPHASNLPVPKNGSPWDDYEELCLVRQGGEVTLVEKKDKTGLEASQVIKTIAKVRKEGRDAHFAALQLLARSRNPQFLEISETYEIPNDGNLYVVCERQRVSISQVIASDKCPDERQIACIISQTLLALEFLETQNLTHGQLSETDVLITEEGCIKLAHPNPWPRLGVQSGESEDCCFLGQMMFQLMDKHSMPPPKGELANREKWSTDALEFLKLACEGVPASTLSKVCFHSWDIARAEAEDRQTEAISSGSARSFRVVRPQGDGVCHGLLLLESPDHTGNGKLRLEARQFMIKTRCQGREGWKLRSMPRESSSRLRAKSHERTAEKCRAETFQGSARVRLDNLTFVRRVAHELNPSNVKRLTQVFKLQGCLRLDPTNHIPALVSSIELNRALELSGITADQLKAPPRGQPYELIFPLSICLQCLHGLHRIEAAKAVLWGPDRWWVVDLFLKDVPPALTEDLLQYYPNAATPTDGEIYYMIEYYIGRHDSFNEDRWWAYLSPSKRTYLKLFRNHKAFIGSFCRFDRFVGLWPGMKIGVLHKLLSLRCDEELLKYLDTIHTFWETLAGGNGQVVDSRTVGLLESRCPRMSRSDRAFLDQKLSSEELFHHLDDSEKQRMWQVVCDAELLIPTFRTFFDDLKYISRCRAVLGFLVPPLARRLDTRLVFKNMFGYDQGLYVQVEQSEEMYVERRVQSFQDAFSVVYRELWLFAMRHWPEFNDDGPRKNHRGASAPSTWESPSAAAERLVRFAHSIGFRCSEGPLSAPLVPTLGEGGRPRQDPLAFSMTSWDGRPLQRRHRSGVPFDSSRVADLGALFIETLYQVPAPAHEFTTFFVRQSLFFTIFGDQNAPINAYVTDTDSAEARPVPVVAPQPGPSATPNPYRGQDGEDSILFLCFDRRVAKITRPAIQPGDSGGPSLPTTTWDRGTASETIRVPRSNAVGVAEGLVAQGLALEDSKGRCLRPNDCQSLRAHDGTTQIVVYAVVERLRSGLHESLGVSAGSAREKIGMKRLKL